MDRGWNNTSLACSVLAVHCIGMNAVDLGEGQGWRRSDEGQHRGEEVGTRRSDGGTYVAFSAKSLGPHRKSGGDK